MIDKELERLPRRFLAFLRKTDDREKMKCNTCFPAVRQDGRGITHFSPLVHMIECFLRSRLHSEEQFSHTHCPKTAAQIKCKTRFKPGITCEGVTFRRAASERFSQVRKQFRSEGLIGDDEMARSKPCGEILYVCKDFFGASDAIVFLRDMVNIGNVAKFAAVEVTSFSRQDRK